MQKSLFDELMQEKEQKNERMVAYARFFFLLTITILDSISYFNLIHYTSIPATKATMILNISFLLSLYTF